MRFKFQNGTRVSSPMLSDPWGSQRVVDHARISGTEEREQVKHVGPLRLRGVPLQRERQLSGFNAAGGFFLLGLLDISTLNTTVCPARWVSTHSHVVSVIHEGPLVGINLRFACVRAPGRGASCSEALIFFLADLAS